MREHNGPVIVVGDACVDVTVSLASISSSAENNLKSEKLKPSLSGGGTSANTAVALSKLGINTAFMGTIGDDYGGRFLLKEFAEQNIDTSFTIVDKSNTVYVFAFIDSTGERTLWAFPREDCSYANLDINRIDSDSVRNASWLHASGMAYMTEGSTRENLPEIFKAAYEAGVPTSFDLNTRVGTAEELDPEIRDAVEKTLPYVTYLLGSGKDEMYSFRPCEDWHDSVREFAKQNHAVIARMGGEGSFYVCGDEEMLLKPYDVPVKNTTGAGDCFNAGFIAGRMTGHSLKDSIIMGNAVAGYKITGNSARHTPDMQELENFMKNTSIKK